MGGDADGIVIKADGRIVWETDDLRCHYALIDAEKVGEKYTIGAYVYTRKGKMIITTTDEFSITEPVYESEEPRISLIIPAYNAEKFIVRTIDTVLAQSQDDIEIVVVDDESTDRTRLIVEWYTERYRSVQLLLQKNAGQASARNTGIDYAHGNYIAFMDHDDLLPVNAQKALYEAVKATGADVATGRVDRIINKCYIRFVYHDYKPNTLLSIETFMSKTVFVVVWNKLYKAELCKKHKFGPKYFEDNAWTPVILSYANAISYTDELVYEFDRSHETQNVRLARKFSQEEKDRLCVEAFTFTMKHCNPAKADLVKKCALPGYAMTLSREILEKLQNDF